MYHQRNRTRSKSFFLFFVLAMCCVFGASMLHPSGRAEAASVSLAWDAASGVSGYKVHYGTTSGSYTASADVGTATNASVPNLSDGTRYYFAVTAYDSSKVESDYSNEVSYGGTTSCTYSISPSSASFTSSGGTGSISVTATSGCSWSASTGVSWATISSGSSGTGSGTVKYSVAANTGSSRTAAFTIAGKSFSITQSGSTTSGTYYTLTVAKAGTGSGTVTVNPSGTSFLSGTYVTLTATPDASSTFTGWSGVCTGSTSTTCSGTMTRSFTATATFTAKTTTSSYTITSSAGTGGSISPSGSVSVTSGSSKSFTITPNTGYKISNVTVDGQSVGAVSSYTFSSIKANHTIAATFAQSSTGTYYTLTVAKAGTGSGTVTVNPSGTSFLSGTYVTLTATPDASSTFTGWSGVCTGSTSTTCSGTMTRSFTATATFTAKTTTSSYTITSSAGTGGSISPSGSVSVTSGSSKSFTITPNTRYKIRYVLVDGRSVGAVSSYTFSGVRANHTIKAYFAYVGY